MPGSHPDTGRHSASTAGSGQPRPAMLRQIPEQDRRTPGSCLVYKAGAIHVPDAHHRHGHSSPVQPVIGHRSLDDVIAPYHPLLDHLVMQPLDGAEESLNARLNGGTARHGLAIAEGHPPVIGEDAAKA